MILYEAPKWHGQLTLYLFFSDKNVTQTEVRVSEGARQTDHVSVDFVEVAAVFSLCAYIVHITTCCAVVDPEGRRVQRFPLNPPLAGIGKLIL